MSDQKKQVFHISGRAFSYSHSSEPVGKGIYFDQGEEDNKICRILPQSPASDLQMFSCSFVTELAYRPDKKLDQKY